MATRCAPRHRKTQSVSQFNLLGRNGVDRLHTVVPQAHQGLEGAVDQEPAATVGNHAHGIEQLVPGHLGQEESRVGSEVDQICDGASEQSRRPRPNRTTDSTDSWDGWT